jgi:NAD(P)-dependent dehydrogenase (short-subunit alcohol dehydrogenase family)
MLTSAQPRQPRLGGRRILVTCAASGIGKAVAELFAEEGARLSLLDRDEPGLTEVAARLNAIAAVADVSSPQQVEAAVANAATALGGLDGVVNAAGIFKSLSLEETTPDIWQRFLDVNLTGPYLVCRNALAHLRKQAGSTVVNVASVAALLPRPNISAYVASKGGLIAFTKSFAGEAAPNVRANVLCPGMVITAITLTGYPDPVRREQIAREKAALQRAADPKEMATIALFLSSHESSFVTGSVVNADGGRAYY